MLSRIGGRRSRNPENIRCRDVKCGRGCLIMTDTTRMTDGIHKGTRLKDVPAAYLLHLPSGIATLQLKKYVEKNLNFLKAEASSDGKLRYRERKNRRWQKSEYSLSRTTVFCGKASLP
jgi:hypothetical protein